MKKVILIEFNTWHIECLYSQLQFLSTSGYYTILVCDIRVKEIVEKYDFVSEFVFYDFKKIISLWRLRSFVLKSKVEWVIYNTAQGSITFKFMLLPFWNKVKFVGTIHNLKKLLGSFGQKIISRKIQSYYVLADYLMKNLPSDYHKCFQSFTPAFFPSFVQQDIAKPEDDIWVCIPGAIEYKRRDYDYLLSSIKNGLVPENVKFILLGNINKGDGPDYIQKIKSNHSEHFFIWFDSFVPNELFYSYLTVSDYLLPLIHPNMIAASDYTKYKISGIFILAQAFHKIMLCHSLFLHIDDFNYPALFYSDEKELVQYVKGRNLLSDETSLNFISEREKYISLLS